MSFESTTLSLLVSDATVTSFVPAANIYFGTLPQDSGKPFILLSRINTQPTLTHDVGQSGSVYIDHVSLMASVYGSQYLNARQASDAVRACLEASSDTKYVLTDQVNAYDDFVSSFSQILTFSAWHRSTTP